MTPTETSEARDEMNISDTIDKCFHKTRKLAYRQAHFDAEQRLKKGEKQVQCPVCKLWFWSNQ